MIRSQAAWNDFILRISAGVSRGVVTDFGGCEMNVNGLSMPTACNNTAGKPARFTVYLF